MIASRCSASELGVGESGCGGSGASWGPEATSVNELDARTEEKDDCGLRPRHPHRQKKIVD